MEEKQPKTRLSRYFESTSERIFAYSDGIFAIAVTLLILEIKAPDLAPNEIDQLPSRLLDLTPQILTYALSFVVIGIYWMLHRRFFFYIKRYNNNLLWLNNLYLMMIAFQPLPTAVLSRYGNRTEAVAFYAGTQIVTALIKLAMWLYASRKHRLIDPNLSSRFITRYTLENISGILIFVISFAVSFVNTDVAKYSWLLLLVDNRVIDMIYPEAPSETEIEPKPTFLPVPKEAKTSPLLEQEVVTVKETNREQPG